MVNVSPGAITVLSALAGTNDGEINLSWIAPGDDEYTGDINPGTFRIQYSTWSGVFWSTASAQIIISTSNVGQGSIRGWTVTGLNDGIDYYFKIWTADENNLWSSVSVEAIGRAPNVPPSAITDLSASVGRYSGEIKLNWTAPGDDGWSGDIVNGKYRIAYSSDSNDNFQPSSYDLLLTTSCSPFTAQSYTVTGFTLEATYYFRIWTGDETPTWSPISNGATTYVPPDYPPVIEFVTVISTIYFESNKAVIDVTVTDDFGVTQVTLFYRKKGGSWQSTSSFSHLPSGTTSYSGKGEIPGSYITTTGTEYYIGVGDGLYTVYWKSKDYPQEITVLKVYQESIISGTITVPDENPYDGEMSLYIPERGLGHIFRPKLLTITQKDADLELPAVESAIDTTKNNGKPVTVFEFGPAGTVFTIPATLTMLYYVSSDIDERTLQMYWYDSGKWNLIGGEVNTTSNTVTAKITRFSKYAIFPSKTVNITAGEKTFLTPYLPVRFRDVITLVVMDIKGNKVIELESLPGANTVMWDGKDESGIFVESGAYIYKVKKVDGRETYGVIVVAK